MNIKESPTRLVELRKYIVDSLDRNYGPVIDSLIREHYSIEETDSAVLSEILGVNITSLQKHQHLTKRLCLKGSIDMDDFIRRLRGLPGIGKVRSVWLAKLAPSLWWAYQSNEEIEGIKYIGKCIDQFRKLLLRIHKEGYNVKN